MYIKKLINKFRPLGQRAILSVLFAVLCASCSRYSVYSVDERPRNNIGGGVVYALPATTVQITFNYTFRDRREAPYANYAEEFLGLQSETPTFELSVADISAITLPDRSQMFYVVPHNTSVQVENLMIKSIGMDAEPTRKPAEGTAPTVLTPATPEVPNFYNLYDRNDTVYTRYDAPGKPSKVLSNKDVKSLRMRARDAAEEIHSLEERRQELSSFESSLSGAELDKAMQQIQQRISDLSDLFIGKRRSTQVTYTFTPQPLSNGAMGEAAATLLYLSPTAGIVDSSYAGAVPVICKVTSLNTLRDAARFINYRANGHKSPSLRPMSDGKSRHTPRYGSPASRNLIQYRLAEKATVSIILDGIVVEKELPILQFGPIMALPKSTRQALFDTHTGTLLYSKAR